MVPVIAAGSLAAYIAASFGGAPAKEVVRTYSASAEACTCDEELRELLRAHADLEWFRLVGLGACFLLACGVVLVSIVGTLAFGCCWPCACLAGGVGRSRVAAAACGRDSPARLERRQPEVLALLAAAEVRR